eukprot:scaffold259520_cov35-Tisochrysis_lutea.AAC.3
MLEPRAPTLHTGLRRLANGQRGTGDRCAVVAGQRVRRPTHIPRLHIATCWHRRLPTRLRPTATAMQQWWCASICKFSAHS